MQNTAAQVMSTAELGSGTVPPADSARPAPLPAGSAAPKFTSQTL
jgi:hypothetical protein